MKQKLLEAAIIADYRERKIIEMLKRMKVKVSIVNLPVGDFVVNNILIERKTHSDFVSSIIDGRLFEQIKLASQLYEKIILVIEGYSNREISPQALNAALAYLITNYNCSILHTTNEKNTASLIYWLLKKYGKAEAASFKVFKKDQQKKLMEKVVASLPGISIVLAKRLLKKFKTIEAIVNAKEAQLMKVEGIGSKKAKKIKEFLRKVYE